MGYFYTLAIINNASMNIYVHVFAWTCVFISFGYILIPRSRIAGLMVTLYLRFEELPNCFPKQQHRFIFLPTMYEGCNFPTSLSTLVIVYLLYFIYLSVRELVCHCGFDLHFLIANVVKHLFMCLLVTCIPSFEKCDFKSFAHPLIGLSVILL